MSTRNASLEQYARRRFVLSGMSVVKDQFPYCVPVERLAAEQRADGSGFTSFAHYDYLALAADPRVRAAAADAAETVGAGVGSSRLVGGERAVHRDLERELADFLGVEDTLTMVSGYGTNVALVSHLLTAGDVILVDEAVHSSILVGTQLSRAVTIPFRHNDVDHLAALLRERRAEFGRALIVLEGLYSMDGDIPDLPAVLALARRHAAWLMVDEAHSIGVLGARGRGIAEHYGIDPGEIDLLVGTLSKSFVSCGGFIAAKAGIIDWLRFTLAGFVYSVGLPAPMAATARAALAILRAEPQRTAKLAGNSRYFVRKAKQRGLDVGAAIGAGIVPVQFTDAPTTIEAANAALEAGYYVPPIVQIAVPRNAPRLRFFVTAGHQRQQIDGVLDTLARFALAGMPAAAGARERHGEEPKQMRRARAGMRA